MGYAKEHRGRNAGTSSSKRQKPRSNTGRRRATGSSASLHPPLYIYQSSLWIPEPHVGDLPRWILACTQGLEGQLSFLKKEQPWLLRNPYQIVALEPHHVSSSWQEALSFPQHHFTFDHVPAVPLIVAKLHLSVTMEPWNERLVKEEPAIDKPAQFRCLDPITPREREVLHCLASGLSNQEIAQQLVIATSTVKWHLKQIYSKLGVCSRTQALVQVRGSSPLL